MSRTILFVILRAVTASPRSESLNIGILAWPEEGPPILQLDRSPSRLRALHPNLARIDLEGWARRLFDELNSISGVANQIAMLPHLVQPFVVDKVPGTLLDEHGDVRAEVMSLFDQMVAAPSASIKLSPQKKRSKLHAEIRTWLRNARLYSSRIEDLSRRRVVSHFPVDTATDLYVDFAFKNGKIHVIETLDLRGIDHVTSSVRGDAALKSITLSEAQNKEGIGVRAAVIHATDHSATQSAVRLIGRYADEVWHMDSSEDRQAFADFISKSLHVEGLAL